MRKMFSVVIMLVILISCNNEKKDNQVTVQKMSTSEIGPKEDSVINKDTFRIENDTTCYETTKFHDQHLRLISACYIAYNNSLSERMAFSYGSGELSKMYNYDQVDSVDLAYTLVNNKINIKLLYDISMSGYKIAPDSIYYKNGIYYLKEKDVKVDSINRRHKIMFEEFNYEFALSPKSKKPIFRHIIFFD